MVEAAQQEAARIVADARAAVGRLREQRQRIAAQLAASRADLDQLVTGLGPLPDEQDSEQATPPTGSPVVAPAPALTPTPHPR